MKKINSLKDSIEEAEQKLTKDIDEITTKKKREEFLQNMEVEIKDLEKRHRTLGNQNKKQRNKNVKRNVTIKLKGTLTFNLIHKFNLSVFKFILLI